MVGGQALDITDDKDPQTINRLKTAKLFEASAVLGAISAHAGKKKISAMRGYGALIGMAFQAIDDILDGENNLSYNGARNLTVKAKAALKIFGNRGDRLKEIADGFKFTVKITRKFMRQLYLH